MFIGFIGRCVNSYLYIFGTTFQGVPHIQRTVNIVDVAVIERRTACV